MSLISNLIFKGGRHYITSKYGARSIIQTAAGDSLSYHSGTDYGTNGLKLPQYAIERGYVFDASKASDGANYVWVIYPRVKLAMLHYHLDSYKVRAGQSVSKGTLLGYTGKTGRATGVHLHLAVRDLSSLSEAKIKNMNWDYLRSCPYADPEKVVYSEISSTSGGFLPARGYFQSGDVSDNISKIASFMRSAFPSYTDKKALGNTQGPYLTASIKEFQKRTGLAADGLIGPKTVAMLKKYGFRQ